MKKACKEAVLFILGYTVYILIELCWRGYSYPLMGVCGGTVAVLLEAISRKAPADTSLLVKSIAGSAVITLFELIIGELFLRGYLPNMWDYSNVFMNFKGIICLPFSLAWVVLSAAAVIVTDAVAYYIFNDRSVPYYKLFGKTVFKLKPKRKSLGT